MLSPVDLLIAAVVITLVVWLNLPKLLVPAVVLTILTLSVYRWRREWNETKDPERYRSRLIASGVLIAVISVPLILKIIPPNGVYGFRTSVTLSRPNIWYSANAFMGWALFVAAIVSAGSVTILPVTTRRWMLLVMFATPLLCAVVASFIYLQRLA